MGRRAPERTSRRRVTSSAFQPLGDRSRTRKRETGPERKLQQYFVHHEQARREEPAIRAGVETVEVVADIRGRGEA